MNENSQIQGTNNVIETTINTAQQLKQSSSVPKDIVFVSWIERVTQFPNQAEVVASKSVDGGENSGDIINLSNTPEDSWRPAVASYQNNVYVV
jgi:hypothetical protein